MLPLSKHLVLIQVQQLTFEVIYQVFALIYSLIHGCWLIRIIIYYPFDINLLPPFPQQTCFVSTSLPVSVDVLCFNRSQSVTGCQLLLIDPGKHISQLLKEPRLATSIGATEPSAITFIWTHGHTHTHML